MNASNNSNNLAIGGRPRATRISVCQPANRAQRRARKARKKTASARIPTIAPEPEKSVRIYKPEEFIDHAIVEGAILEHIERTRKASKLERASVASNYINGSTFIAYNGTESLVLSFDELITLVLGDKTIAAQLCFALAATPIPLTIPINIISNTSFTTNNRFQAPTNADCEATKLEDLSNIYSSFYFKKLPNEVRKMIYLSSDVFALGHDGQIPPFYHVTLCDSFLHEEAKSAYKKINFHLTLANEKEFNKMPGQDVQYLRHLYFQWSDL